MADTVLQALGRKIDAEMIMPLRQSLIGRKLAAINPDLKGDGIFEVVHNTMNELGTATISYSLPRPDGPRDSVTATRTTLKVPVLSEGFEISREDYDVYKNSEGRTPIDTNVALSAAQVVGVKEDDLIINGWKADGTNAEITGFYAGAGNSYTTNKDFATAGYPTTVLSGMLALIEADSALADAYNFVCNPVQRNELRGLRSAQGVREEPEFVEMLNPGGGKTGGIISTSTITAGTGLLSPVDPNRRFVELVVPRDYRTSMGVDSKAEDLSPIYGTVYCMTIPKIKQAAGLCSATQI